MRYTLKPLHCRPWLLQGLSPRLIESHYENTYGGPLCEAGLDAKYMRGGDSAWKAIGGPVKLNP